MPKLRGVAVLGSTGSIGVSTLDVLSRHTEEYRVVALTAYQNGERLLQQCQQFKPDYAVLVDEPAARQLAQQLKAENIQTEVLSGAAALAGVVQADQVDIVMAAIVGSAGLSSSLAAARSGKKILLANKESLVMTGELFMEIADDSGSTVIPIDSEHNAIFQCLPDSGLGIQENQFNHVEKVVLTASGGPFLNLPPSKLKEITPEQACAHPKWKMGKKISVDSSTMMNKGLEFIEAHYLFRLGTNKIDVLIHPQSIIHSLVYFNDGSVLAQMADPDMRIPIAYGLAYPGRLFMARKPLDLVKAKTLEFSAVDEEQFPCLRLGILAAQDGGTAPVSLNAANEVAVDAFLAGKIKFTQIPMIIESVMGKMPCEAASSLAIIRSADKQARYLAKELIFKEI